jgi:transposase
LTARVEAARPDWIPATVLFDEIAALGYEGSVRTVSGYLAMLKPKGRDDPLVRFETPPGRQMQVDWGAFKLNGQRISLFFATLGWSRFNFGLFVDNERFDTLRECHEQAFDAYSGQAGHPFRLKPATDSEHGRLLHGPGSAAARPQNQPRKPSPAQQELRGTADGRYSVPAVLSASIRSRSRFT